MLASLGKENGGADIKGVFELKLASRSKRQRVTIANLLMSPNKENKQLQKDKSETDIIDMDDLSSISSVKSDNELWDCIEMGRGSKRLSRLERMSLASDQQRRNLGDLFYQSSENLIDKDSDLKSKLEKYEHTIEKMKEAQRLEIIAISESLRNKAKDMLAQKAEELKRNFDREIKNLVNQLTEAKRMLVIKEGEIGKLKELAQQYENSLTLIKSNSLYKLHPRTIKSSETGDDSTFSKEELSALKKELESMKAILLTFKKDDEIKTRELAKARQEMNNMTRQHAEQIQNLTQQFEEKMKSSDDQSRMHEIKCERVKKELEKFKMNADLEIKVLKALNERYKHKSTDTSVNTTLPLKEVFVKGGRGSALTDILNTSMASDATGLASRYSSQPHNTSYEHKGRARATSKPRPGLDNLEAPSLSALEPFSNGQSTAYPKSKVTFLDSSKNETGRNVSMEIQ